MTTLPKVSTWPPWMQRAAADVGVRELPGIATHPRIAEYYDHTQAGDKDPEDGSTAWCSAAMCCWMEESGYKSPHSTKARDWLGWGDELKQPRLGCIVVLWRENPSSWKGHVAFYCSSERHNRVQLLGGNQGSAVSFQLYESSRVLSYRWPKESDRLPTASRS